MANIPGTLGQAVTPQTFAPNLNINIGGVYNLTLSPANVSANTTGTYVLTNTGLGLQVNDFVVVQLQSAQTLGLFISNAWVSAADTLSVAYTNVTAGGLVPVNGVYDILVMRPDANISQQVPAIQP